MSGPDPGRPVPAPARDRVAALTLAAGVAPVVWGSTYLVTTELLPEGRPMTAAVLRALPAGLFLLLLAPGVPPRGWRSRTAVLGLLNVGAFFPLLFVAAYRLPGGLAAVVGSLQPLVIAALGLALGWGRAPSAQVRWSLVAVLGVSLVTLTGHARVDRLGLVAAVLGTVSMAGGILLTRRWGAPPATNPLNSTAWQLLVGGLVIVPLVPVLDSGAWHVDAAAAAGYTWLALVGGALAYALWLRGARELPATNMGLLGMLSPLTAAALGWAVLGQALSPVQCAGFLLTLVGSALGQLRGSGQLPGSGERPPRRRPPVPAGRAAVPGPPPSGVGGYRAP